MEKEIQSDNRNIIALSRINLDLAKGKKYTICQSGYYEDAYGFGIKFDDEILDKLIRNFKAQVLSSGAFVYYGHWDSKREAAGEVVSLKKEYDSDSGKTCLNAEIEWTGEGEKKVKDKAYNFFSVEIATDYSTVELNEVEDDKGMRTEKNKISYGPTLTGVALTNEPAVHDLPRMKMSGTGEKVFSVFTKKNVAQDKNMNQNNLIDNKSKENTEMDEKIKKQHEDQILALTKKLEDANALVKKMEEASKKREKELFEKERNSFSKTLFESEKISKETADAIDKIEDKAVFAGVKEVLELSVASSKSNSNLPKVEGTSKTLKDSDIIGEFKFDVNKENLNQDDLMRGIE